MPVRNLAILLCMGTSLAMAATPPSWVVLDAKRDCTNGPLDLWDACKHRDWSGGGGPFQYIRLAQPQDCDYLKDTSEQARCRQDLAKKKNVYATSDSQVTLAGRELPRKRHSNALGATVAGIVVVATIGAMVWVGYSIVMLFGQMSGSGE
jgi:hypothetical protein